MFMKRYFCLSSLSARGYSKVIVGKKERYLGLFGIETKVGG
jgi:hypothetical protein